MDKAVWIISLNFLSKTFDWAPWLAVWPAPFQQRSSQLASSIYKSSQVSPDARRRVRFYNKCVVDNMTKLLVTLLGPISCGLRENGVCSPRLFYAVLEFATQKWWHALGKAQMSFQMSFLWTEGDSSRSSASIL